MNELITTAIALGASTITSLVTFLFTRRKYLAEVKGSDLENLQKSLQIYIDIVEDNKKRIDLYQAEIERCNKEVFALRTENRDLRNQLQSLSLQIIRQSKPNYNHAPNT
jgi:chromosome segregation ATPase